MRRRVYRQYEVEYSVNDHIYVGTLQTEKRGLSPGNIVEVRYICMEDSNEPQMVSCKYADRIKELVYGAIGGVILAYLVRENNKDVHKYETKNNYSDGVCDQYAVYSL